MIEGMIDERQGRSDATDVPIMSGIATLIQAHLATLAVVKSANYWPETPKWDAIVDTAMDDASAALDALARAPCKNAEGFSTKMRYLISYSHEDEDKLEPLQAIRMAVELWEEERKLV